MNCDHIRNNGIFRLLAVLLYSSFILLTGCSKEEVKSENAQSFTNMAEQKGDAAESANDTGTADTAEGKGNKSDEKSDFLESGNNSGTSDNNGSNEGNSNPYGILKGRVICIDPGHQAKADVNKEPIAPYGSETKEKMAWGTQGVYTKVPEYRLNLEVSLKLKELLESYEAKVFMTRETNEVNLSNIDRAKLANESGAEIVVRIHADGLDNSKVKGMSILYPGNKYVKDDEMIAKSRKAAQSVLKAVISNTGAASRGIIERDDLTGFNWSKIPVFLIEMGFMSNVEEDKLLNTGEYQNKIAAGIVKGLADYFTLYQ